MKLTLNKVVIALPLMSTYCRKNIIAHGSYIPFKNLPVCHCNTHRATNSTTYPTCSASLLRW